ncbi:MAG: dihydropteroate synthase [gamma proteobacterium symbiont of Bathyaustriella thionipta]|nr:dihydropteroate synthase [gamma proteobacterium symbiont of Bathyaustriella thionipta]
MHTLDCGGRPLDLSSPQVMGILNVTPDSFSDGGRFLQPAQAVEQALAMQKAGAAIIDIGGESTRPGAPPVSVEQELQRVLPVIEHLQAELAIPLSIDTRKPEVMRAAVQAGAGMINDVNALRAPAALSAAIECAVPVCLMHMQGEPANMQAQPHYQDVVREVRDFLLQRADALIEAGFNPRHILLDPGFGFGKTLQHNLSLLRHLQQISSSSYPVLVGLSRKSMFAQLSSVALEARLGGSIAAAFWAAQKGACLLRVHDVQETVQALTLLSALQENLNDT